MHFGGKTQLHAMLVDAKIRIPRSVCQCGVGPLFFCVSQQSAWRNCGIKSTENLKVTYTAQSRSLTNTVKIINITV